MTFCTCCQVQVEYLATAEGLQEAANAAAAAVEYIGIEQGAAAALIDESGNLIHSGRSDQIRRRYSAVQILVGKG